MEISNLSGGPVQRTYTIEQVAKILGVSIRTAYNICEIIKDFKVMRLSKHCLRIHKKSFDIWFDGLGNTS